MTKAYYKGWFKLHEVEIIKTEKWRNFSFCSNNIDVFYKYIIKFKSGRLKLVHENKLVL